MIVEASDDKIDKDDSVVKRMHAQQLNSAHFKLYNYTALYGSFLVVTLLSFSIS